jgi:hypothetical protein
VPAASFPATEVLLYLSLQILSSNAASDLMPTTIYVSTCCLLPLRVLGWLREYFIDYIISTV